MKHRLITNSFVFIALCISIVTVTGCGTRALKLTETDNGSDVNLDAGGQLMITLPGNPSTGYSWEVLGVDGYILAQEGEPEFIGEDSMLVGLGGQVRFIFIAKKAGSTTLELVYHRPWETNVAPLQTFTIHVTVK